MLQEWKDETIISRKTAETFPDNAWALTALGINFMDRKNYTAALVPLEKAVALCEKYEFARNTLGECYLNMGRYKDAVTQFIEALKINTASFKTRNFLGVAYASLKKYDEAEKQFIVALKLAPEFLNAHLNLGRLYELKGDYGKSIKQYEKALEAAHDAQDRAVLFIRIGDAYLKAGSRKEAKGFYLEALDIAGKESEFTRKLIEDRLKTL